VAAIIETKNGIILTKRKLNPKKDFLDLPGGFTDYNESLEVALKREVKEEINLEIYDLSYFGSYPNKYIYKNVTYFTIDSVFICKAKSLKDIRKSKEIDNILFCHPEKIPILKLGFKSTKKAILEYLDYLNNKK
jgi:ADP-ribose pyrophosphatase YjhB (NUDIX family)